MRLALPQDVLVGFVEPDSSSRGQLEEVLIIDGIKGRMAFQEVGDAIADGGGFHVGAIVDRGAVELYTQDCRDQLDIKQECLCFPKALYNHRDGCPIVRPRILRSFERQHDFLVLEHATHTQHFS